MRAAIALRASGEEIRMPCYGIRINIEESI